MAARAFRLAPSLLSADFADLAGAIRAAERGGAGALHLDVMDGHFVPNISFGPALVQAVRARTALPLDVHLMISEPSRYAESFARAGGSTLVFHAEAEGDPGETIRRIHDLGVAAGIAVKPGTPVSRLDPYLPSVDQILVMSVEPGFSGQEFIPAALAKLREARHKLDEVGSRADLSVDGGIGEATAGPAAREGATFFVCGNSVFARGQVEENLGRLRQAIERGRADAVR